jgi:glycine/D-amino acid oxidase-like deaminating enzyme
MRTADAVIIGGGIVGCAAAYYLSAHGVRPLLLECGTLAGEASGANMGVVGASAGLPGRTVAHTRKSMDLLARDAEALGRPVELVREGHLIVALTEAERAEVNAVAAAYGRDGVEVRTLSGEEARELVPGLGPKILEAAYVPGDGHVNPFLLTFAYAAAARRQAAKIEEGTEVTRLTVERGRLTGLVARGEEISTPLVVLAAGAWSGALLRPLGLTLPVRPGRGQMLVTAPLPPITSRVVLTPGATGVRQDVRGHVLIGSTVEDAGFDRSVTLETLAGLSRVAAAIMPALHEAPVIRTWAGLRPMSPDGVPIIDRAPGVSGLLLATGHSRVGLSYAPVTGWLLAQLVTSRATDLPLEPFRAERFMMQPT